MVRRRIGRTRDESQTTLGHWLASRPGVRDRVHPATKAGARPVKPGGTLDDAERVSDHVLREALIEHARVTVSAHGWTSSTSTRLIT